MLITRLPPTLAVLVIFLLVLVAVDLLWHRIPNRITVSAALVAVLLNALTAGDVGALRSVEGLAVGLATFMPLFLTGGFSAGDVKAMAAVGAFLGPMGALFAALWSLTAGTLGGLLILLSAAGPGALRAMFQRWTLRAYVLCTTGARAHISAAPDDAAMRRFPFGAAIACGTIASLIWNAYHG